MQNNSGQPSANLRASAGQARRHFLALWFVIGLAGLGAKPLSAAELVDISRSKFGHSPLFVDPETQVKFVQRDRDTVRVVVGKDFFAHSAAQELAEQDRIDAVLGWLETQGAFSRVDFLIRDDDGSLRPPPRRQWPAMPSHGSAQAGAKPWWVTPPDGRFPYGAPLTGKTIALSAGHGWIYENGSWRTQRSRYKFDGCGSCRGIVEDHSNADLVARWLIPFLEGAGAHVVPVREPSLLDWGQVIDDGDAAMSEQGAWAAGSSPGGWQGDYRVLAAGESGQVQYLLDVPRAQPYRLSLRYVEGSNRSSASWVDVIDAVSSTRYVVDQRQFGRRFMPLGVHSLTPGDGALVRIQHGSDDGFIIADALQVGGGIHTNSGYPWWQMSALEYVDYNGASSDVTSRGDVTIRPAFAEYVGADAYLSFHSNATGGEGTASGSTSYRFNCLSYADHSTDPPAADCDDPVGSDALQAEVHSHLIDRLRSDWDPNWCDRGTRVANFGELRELVDIPGVLVESAFHDNLTASTCPNGNPVKQADNKSLHDPDFRRLVGRALYEGLLQYLAPNATALLDSPTQVRAVSDDQGGLLVRWQAVSGARGYRVYVAKDGLSFDRGRDSESTELRLTDLTPLAPVCLRVATLNEGGVGLAGATFCARPRMARTQVASAEILLVDGFDRLDPWVQEIDNHQDASRRHAQALAAITAFDVAADVSSDEAVATGAVSLTPYRALVMAFGEESTADRTFSAELQARVDAFRASGGAVIVSGAEIGWDLSRTGDPGDLAWLTSTFAADFASDDGESHQVEAEAAGPLSGMSELHFCAAADLVDDPDCYDVEWPDVWTASSAGQVLLRYVGHGVAAVYQSGSAPTVLMGFPFETVSGADARRDLMQRLLNLCLQDLVVGDLDLDGMPDVWEQQNGLDPADASDAEADGDNDGTDNLHEYLDGTDPWNGAGPPDAGPTADATADASSNDAGANTDAGLLDAAPGSGGDTPPVEDPGCGCGGCGDCRSAGSAESQGLPVALLAGLAIWVRRKRLRSKIGPGSKSPLG